MIKLLINLRLILSAMILLLTHEYINAEWFNHFSVKDGLQSRQIFGLKEDAGGFIWIYNDSGIDRFDGSEVRHYHLPGMDNARDYIEQALSISTDPDGVVWAANRSGVLYSYDQHHDTFVRRYDLQSTDWDIYNFKFDSNGNLYLCTSDGVYKVIGDDAVPVGCAGHYVYDLVISKDGTLFAATENGVVRLADGNENVVSGLQNMRIKSLEAIGDKIYVGTFERGVYILDLASGQSKRLPVEIPMFPVNSMASIGDEVLIGVDGAGVYRVDAATGNLNKHYISSEEQPGSLASNTVTEILVDVDGRIWIGTSANGISFLPNVEPSISVIEHIPYNRQSLIANFINTVFTDSDGDTWFGTENGVSMYSPKTEEWVHYLDGTGFNTNVMLAASEDAMGRIWVGGYGPGTYVIDKDKHSLRKVPSKKEGGVIGTEYVFEICSVGDDVWIGGIEGDLTRYNIRTGECRYFPAECIRAMEPGRNDTLFIAGCAGLGIFSPEADSIRWISDDGEYGLFYPVRSLAYDDTRNELWLATDGDGLMCYNVNDGRFTPFMPESDISEAQIKAVVMAPTGEIYFCTENAMFRTDKEHRDYRRINVSSLLGRNNGAFNLNAAALIGNKIAFGTTEGIITFDPSLEMDGLDNSKLIFTDLLVHYDRVNPGEDSSILPVNIDEAEHITLPHDKNTFTIAFSSINFNSPRRIRYEYILDGYESQWRSPQGGVNSETYINVPSGDYLFKVRSYDTFSNTIIDERSLPITVKSPWWMSWWAKIIYILLIAGITYAGVRVLRRRQNEKRITEKIQTFVNIAHDIRTPITLIKAPLSELESQPDLTEKSKQSVEVAKSNVTKLLDMITEIVDLQRENNHSDDLNLTACDLKNFLNAKVDEFSCVAVQKGIALKLYVDESLPYIMIDEKKMSHIVDNLLSNALKYTSEGEINVRAVHQAKKWTLTVADTGMGIPKKDIRNIMRSQHRASNAVASEALGSGIGLLITKRLVRLHKGKISFESEEGKGTVFSLTFPIIEARVSQIAGDNTPAAPESHDTNDETSTQTKPVIYLAEDNNSIRSYLSSALSDEYSVVATDDGAKLLEAVGQSHPDIIISDVKMPNLGGDELCRRIKSSIETSHIPVILLTGLGERNDIIAGYESGANDYIVKPFDMSVLKARIKNILINRSRLQARVVAEDCEPAEEDYASSLDKEFMERVKSVLDKNMEDSDFTIGDFCQQLGMSRTSVYNKIKTLSGMSINDFIRVMRLNKAKGLLESGKYQISEVAYMVGFADPKYFSTCFKKQFGVSPSKL